MMLEVPAATLVRAGGSFLLALAGAMILALARRDRGNFALGAYFVAEGVIFTGNNLLAGHATAGWIWVPLGSALNVVSLVGAVGLLLWWPASAPRERRHVLVPAVVFLGVFAAYAGGWPTTDWAALLPSRSVPTPAAYVPLVVAQTVLDALATASIAAFAALAPLRFASSAADQGLLRRQLALVGVLVLPGLVVGLTVLRADGQLRAPGFVAGAAAVILVVVPLWLAATRGHDGRLARNAALVIVALALLGAVLQAVSLRTGDPTVLDAAVGIQRSAFAFLLAFGVLRLGLLGYDPALRTAQRGTIAMASLAALFIVAQIAQNFLAAQYGLLMGGIVAGALLFAATPIQRAIERSHAPTRAPSTIQADDDVYRRAVRLALRDRRLTREEEIDLHALATRLGLTGERAHEIIVELERALDATRDPESPPR